MSMYTELYGWWEDGLFFYLYLSVDFKSLAMGGMNKRDEKPEVMAISGYRNH